MKAIRLPAGTLYVRFDELPHLLAGALHPESSQDEDNLDAALAEIGYEGGDLRRAVESGALVVKNPLTMLPLSFTLGQALNRGVVTVDDLQMFTAGLGLSVAVGGDRAKPWEKLFPLYEPREGLYMLAQAAQEIADSDGWGDESWEALEQRMLEAVRDGKLPRRCRRTGMEVLPDSNEFLVLVTIDDVNAWLATERVAYRWKRHPATAQSAAEPAPVVPDSASNARPIDPLPVATGNIALAFNGLRRWDEKAWKDNLGSPPKWLDACIAIRGQRGIREHHWNPVLIGAALVRQGHAKPNNIRARFQTKAQLEDWEEAWKTYEADNFDTQ